MARHIRQPIKRKMTIDEYVEREFTPSSKPCRRTVVNWIKKGILPGTEFGGKYWVYEQNTEADALVDRVLKAV